MRILLTTEAFAGGVRRHVLELCGGIRQAGHEPILAVSCERDRSAREALVPLLAQGIACHEIPMRRAIAPFADYRAYRTLTRLIRDLHPDLIHAHSAKAGILARMAGKRCRIPVIYTPHAFPFLMTHTAFVPFYRAVEAHAVRWTAQIIVLSEQERLAAESLGYPKERIHLIPNGIPADTLPPLRADIQTPFRIGVFGRCCRQKGSDRLAAIIRSSRDRTWWWEIFGSGPMEQELTHLGDRITCHGAYPSSEAIRLMRQTDAILLPSRWEGCPYTILEAWAAGIPVIGSAIGGITDLITDGETGLLADGDTPAAWLAALTRLAEDPALRVKLAEGGRDRLTRRHTLEQMIRQTLHVYTKGIST